MSVKVAYNNTIKELRELNRGANPELVTKDSIVSLDGDSITLDDGMLYYKTECVSELEYIMNYKGIYGIVYKGEYYRQA